MRLLFVTLALVAAPLIHAQEAPKYAPPAEVKASFKKLLDRPKVPLDVKITMNKDTLTNDEGDGFELQKLTFASEKKADGKVERVPDPHRAARQDARASCRTVIVLHGTGGNKDSQLGFMKELAKRKIIGIAIDARYHGAPIRAAAKRLAAAYNDAITKAWLTKPGQPMEHPFYYDTVWDLWRLVDYLETRDDIDAKNIGMIGFSMGGIQTYLAAAADERVKVSVPAIAVQSFRWSLENDQWQGRANTIKAAHLQAAKDLGEKEINQKVCRALWSKVVPGILDNYDCPSMIRLFAGRPLMIVSGTKDGNCPYGGAKLAIAAAERAFQEAKAADKLNVLVEEVGHTVTPKQRTAALDWFEKWLK